MVELQSCAGMVNASALCAIEQEVNGDGVMNVIAEISSELQREREKNAELMEKISILEAQLLERDKVSIVTDENGCCHNAKERRFKKFKRQKSEPSSNRIGDGTASKSTEIVPQMKHDIDTQDKPLEEGNQKDRLVNWVSMDETQFLFSEELKDGDSGGDCNDTEDIDDEDDNDDFYKEDGIDNGHRDVENDENSRAGNGFKDHLCDEGISQNMHRPVLESSSGGHSVPPFLNMTQETEEDEKKDLVLFNSIPINNKRKLKKLVRKEIKRNGECKGQLKMVDSGQEMYHKGHGSGHGSLTLQKKPPKVAFCPKEVKRMIDLKALLLKNAQSHIIRKIIVFASLGIRHGCEDMYELDFNHFSILRKGDPYVSPTDPGEHVLYENPGVRRKVFYPNRENPTLCPVQILEEEKAMRPSDTSCPSCLFLCIKYGGRTRNLPQNEYVRQRMGRNKLKSFGPVMCRMAMLVHIRSGSFFFKALGITLLFMAGFPDNLVQKETKYRNLDLLQKYYRTDEDVEGEELFLPYPMSCDTQPSPSLQKLTGKASSKKLKGRKQTISASVPQNLSTSLVTQSAPPNSAPPTQFGLMGYTSNHTNLMAALQSMPSQTSPDIPFMSNPVINTSSHNISYHNQTQYPMLQPQPTNAFMTMMYWPPPNAYPPCPYPSSYDYRPFPSIGNYMPTHSQPYFSHPSCSSFVPKIVEGVGKNDTALEEADSDSDSSSSSTEPKEVLASFQQ